MSVGIFPTSYRAPPATSHSSKRLVVDNGLSNGVSFTFFDHIEIGRHKEGRDAPGLLLVKDPTVSSRHCVITQDPDGRCFVRDTSRNGTRLNGRRLSPNLKTELKIGQILSIGKGLELRLDGDAPTQGEFEQEPTDGTIGVSNPVPVTVLVGDIRDYTGLVQRAASSEVQDSVGRVFERLERAVVKLGGTLKEFQGDAIFAFWEAGCIGPRAPGRRNGKRSFDLAGRGFSLAHGLGACQRSGHDFRVWERRRVGAVDGRRDRCSGFSYREVRR